jgi:N-acetyl-1-D-myo-inositol-2-amino-2-deoxy-alpha-D-glucopyranoside deacetylase
VSGHRSPGNAAGPLRLLFVHAHPDDETLTTGITMASHIARGHDVHLLTCTLGEEGEIIPPTLAHLGSGRGDALGAWRREELRAAMSVLGVEHSVLGEDPGRRMASRYRDSGMAGAASAEHPNAFARADVVEAAAMVAAHIRVLRPNVVVTYDEHGGYAHPDHIQTHLVTMSALSALATEEEARANGDGPVMPAVYCILTPQSWATQDRAWLQDHVVRHDDGASIGSSCVVLPKDAPYPPSVVSDEIVTHIVEEPALVDIQSRALAQHATQVSVFDGYYALSNHIAVRLSGREGFARFDPVRRELLSSGRDVPRHTGLLSDSQGR